MQYYVVAYPGSGISFFTGMLDYYLKKEHNISISQQGHCHDLGHGIFKGTNQTEPISFDFPIKTVTNSKKSILSGHYANLTQVKKIFPNIKIILIDIKESFLKTALTMRVYKAINPMSKKEYDQWTNRFGIKHWPEYSEVVANLELVKDDLIKFDTTWCKEWYNAIDQNQVDYVINFETIFGIDDRQVNFEIAKIVNMEVDPTLDQFIEEYQRINQTLYFNK